MKAVFLTPERVIGDASDELILQSDEFISGLSTRGTLDDWRESVSTLCQGNRLLIFAVSVAFAAPLLYLANDESGGFHLVGGSSFGKTTALKLAASVFGGPDYMLSFRATTSGIEGVAAARNDLLLVLDEIQQVSPETASEIAYLLANGVGKQRANRYGTARGVSRWRILFLSSGEKGLEQHLASANIRASAGQLIRVININADAGAKLGIFEDLHGHFDGHTFARALQTRLLQNYGTAGPAFIDRIAKKFDGIAANIHKLRPEFCRKYLSASASGQAQRVASHFALVGYAGELAARYGITNWEPGEASEAAGRCLQEWLEHRGGTGPYESAAILSQVKLFFEQHGESRFSRWTEHLQDDARTVNRAGFKREIDGKLVFYVLPEVFRTEICKGFDIRIATKVLCEAGFVTPADDCKSSVIRRLPGIGPTRIYEFTSKVIVDA